MSRYQTFNAIILSTEWINEKDLRCQLLTQHDGKRWLKAPGAKASQKGSAAGLQPGNHVQVQVYRRGQNDTLQQLLIIDSPLFTVQPPEKLNTLHYMLWVLRQWCDLDHSVPDLYTLLLQAIGSLGTIQPSQLELLKRRFERALLRAEGLWSYGDELLSFREFRQVFEEHTHSQMPQQWLLVGA